MTDTRQLMSDAKFFADYSRYITEKERYETWDEAVDRVVEMHKGKYATEIETNEDLNSLIQFAEAMYKNQAILGAQRALQFGGAQILKHNIKLYNCVSSHIDRPEFFNEYMYMLLCGAGAGFSVQKHHINKLPEVVKRNRQAKIYVVEDSIEGWSDAIGVLLASYFIGGGKFPEYYSRRVYFDLNQIRAKGSLISGGFKAPGPAPLRKCLDLIERLLEDMVADSKSSVALKPIQAYDICMHIADAVLAGGVRRAATICMFSFDDIEMIKAKTGNWYTDHPQRARSNNSAVILRNTIQWETFQAIMVLVEEFGEPGFIFTDNLEFTFNPCVEIGKLPVTVDGVSGWQGCNLAEINGAYCTTPEKLYAAAKAAAVFGTLQAGYTDFPYLPKASQEIFEREALIGVSITGWMNNPTILFDEEVMTKAAEIVVATNKKVAKMIGINQAARTTCVKPSGNASVILQTASGIHGEHAPRYIRNVQMNKELEVSKLFVEKNPAMIEPSAWSDTDYIISFPVIPPETSIFRKDLVGVKLLEYVRKVQNVWIEVGTNVKLCTHPKLRHNVSNTITVKDWDEVAKYVFKHKDDFCGISFLGYEGDKNYVQAPFTEVLSEEELVEKYGPASFFASGLIVDALNAFNSDLWRACKAVIYDTDEALNESHHNHMLALDWVRRAKKFAENYFDNDIDNMIYCLKDVYILHKWHKIVNEYVPIDWSRDLGQKEYVDIDTLGAVACSGGVCEISF